MANSKVTHVYEIFRGGFLKRQWYFRVRSTANGKKLSQSEGYHNLVDCEATVDLLRCDTSSVMIIGEVRGR